MYIKINKTTREIVGGPDFSQLTDAWRFCNRKDDGGNPLHFVTFVTRGNLSTKVVVFTLTKEDGSGARFNFTGKNLKTGGKITGYYDLAQDLSPTSERGRLEEFPVSETTKRRRITFT